MTSHQPLPAFAGWAGPRQPKALLLGEAWGEAEETAKAPFVGTSGKELWRMLGEALPSVASELWHQAAELHNLGNSWISRRGDWLAATGFAMANVLNLRPQANDLRS